jgi:hypothetical protein
MVTSHLHLILAQGKCGIHRFMRQRRAKQLLCPLLSVEIHSLPWDADFSSQTRALKLPTGELPPLLRQGTRKLSSVLRLR